MEVSNRCGYCGGQVSLEELEAKRCESCELPINTEAMKDYTLKCYCCGKEFIARMDSTGSHHMNNYLTCGDDNCED